MVAISTLLQIAACMPNTSGHYTLGNCGIFESGHIDTHCHIYIYVYMGMWRLFISVQFFAAHNVNFHLDFVSLPLYIHVPYTQLVLDNTYLFTYTSVTKHVLVHSYIHIYFHYYH